MNLSAVTARLRHKATTYYAGLLPFGRSLRRDLPPHLSLVKAASAELDAAMEEIEARFLEISNTIESTTTTGQELVEHGEALISLALGQGGGQIIIETTAEHIWCAVEFVEHNVADSEQLICELTTANEQISKSLSTEEELARTLAPLTYVQSLFRVESAGLAPEVQTMFQALVIDIERVRQSVESGFREKFQLIRDIQAILQRAIIQLSQRAKQAKLAVAGLRDSLTQSLAKMRDSYEKNRDRDTRLAGVSRSVTQETGRVVMSLQFFDTFTQKLQHARTIQEELVSRYSSLPSLRTQACLALRFMEQAGRICGAQLGTMNSELVAAGAVVSTGMQSIMTQMSALDADCVALRDLDNVTTGVDGAVQILLDSLSDVQRLVGEAENFAKESHEAIAPVGGMTTNFTKFIHNLSFEIQLIGLNAEVQSAHIGQGTGLDVLSAQTSAISRETNILNTKLAVELDRLTAGLDKIVGSFREIRERSVAYNQTLVVEAAEHEKSLHAYRDSALQVLWHIGELLPKLEKDIRSATEQADFVTLAAEPLLSLQTAVSDLSAAAKSAADKSSVEIETAGLTEHFLKIYTMKSEVDAHHQALGRAPAAPAAATVFADIDLFGDDAPAGPAAAPATTPTPSGEVDLFGDDVPTPPTPAVTPTLSDDVVLFDDEKPSSAPSPLPEVPLPVADATDPAPDTQPIAALPVSSPVLDTPLNVAEPALQSEEIIASPAPTPTPTVISLTATGATSTAAEVTTDEEVWIDPPSTPSEPQSVPKKQKKRRSR